MQAPRRGQRAHRSGLVFGFPAGQPGSRSLGGAASGPGPPHRLRAGMVLVGSGAQMLGDPGIGLPLPVQPRGLVVPVAGHPVTSSDPPCIRQTLRPRVGGLPHPALSRRVARQHTGAGFRSSG